MESNDKSKNEFRDLTEEEKYLIENTDLSLEEYESLSDDEKTKYHKEMFCEKTSNEDTLKELDEVSESILKKINQNKSLCIG